MTSPSSNLLGACVFFFFFELQCSSLFASSGLSVVFVAAHGTLGAQTTFLLVFEK